MSDSRVDLHRCNQCDVICVVRVDGTLQCVSWCFFVFQAEDGIRDLVRSRGLGDVYKRQVSSSPVRSSKKAIASSLGIFSTSNPRLPQCGLRLSLIHI